MRLEELQSCEFHQRIDIYSGNKFGHRVYQLGNPCKVRDDCDVGQTCSAEEGLCVVTLEELPGVQ